MFSIFEGGKWRTETKSKFHADHESVFRFYLSMKWWFWLF